LVLGALGAYTQAGRAIYDLNKRVYRVRELSREPLPVDRLRFANPREESATRFIDQGAVKLESRELDAAGLLSLLGSVTDKEKVFKPKLVIDRDERMVSASCSCNWHQQNKLYQGPCEHILALRKQSGK
ncbi:MAG TPA: SWIM zinc finger family protein, partial [Blastocatellia bacterium]|nr:SWIM zinc finger family protein [Blastocatellia bacterium]